MSCPVPPELNSATLRRVIPVGQHAQVADVGITVYSIEDYEHGFIAVVRMDWDRTAAGCFPGPRFNATDDCANTYTGFGGGGSGGGRIPDRTSWRTWQIFSPGLAADATQLTLEVAEFRLTSFTPNPDRPGVHSERVERTTAGPWRFNIALR